MRSRSLRWILGGIGAFFILSSLAITVVEYTRFSAQPVVFPPGSTLAEVPVGGLMESEAAARLDSVFSLPLVLEIEGSTIHADPDVLGFRFDPQALAAEALDALEPSSFWSYLWGRANPQAVSLPFSATVDDSALADYLQQEIVPRYTRPGRPLTPVFNTTNFLPPTAGERLDIDQAAVDIEVALLSPGAQQVILQTIPGPDQTHQAEMLQAFLQHNINWIGFDQLVEIYLEPLPSGDILHFASLNGAPVDPDVAFTAASTIKIPIMISVLRRTPEPIPEDVVTLLERMIVYSENPPADTLMSAYLDETRGPLIVSEDLSELGMENTFLAGYFYLGAPVLQLFETPANTRTDVFLDPDVYNQTVPSEAGRLLSAIYRCAENGSGLLPETFPGEITQAKCQLMVDILAANQIGLLIEAGLPPEGTAAHKHGWVQELDGLLHSMSDVAIVFTPEQDYVLTIFIYDPQRLDFDQGNRLIARLSQTVYNFFNTKDQAYWWFE